MNFRDFKKLSGDASHRNFYRNKKNNSIIVYTKNDKFKNLLIYDSINKLLNLNNIDAPILINQYYAKNYIEISDLGDEVAIKKFRKFKLVNYKPLFKILNKLINIKQRKIKTFLNTYYEIPQYTDNLLFREAILFSKWYLPTKMKRNTKKISNKFNLIIRQLIKKISLKKKVLVHRDFHLSNIIIFKKKTYLIDNQDAVYGSIAYDIASLIDDVRIKVSRSNREKLYSSYISNIKILDQKKFRNDFEIISILRNLKIIGIFTRLSKRDKKHSYLKMIPYAWKLIDERRKFNIHTNQLNLFLDKYFANKKY
tara:strand:- start:8443 stop:9372 length:930 start_codon:yes stop_codon:yes gene_type:complete